MARPAYLQLLYSCKPPWGGFGSAFRAILTLARILPSSVRCWPGRLCLCLCHCSMR